MTLNECNATAEAVTEAIGSLGLGRTGVLLSEGYCPLCRIRGVDRSVVDIDAIEERTATTTVNCERCVTRWRAGINPENGQDWIEHSRSWREGVLLTMTLNPPPEDWPEREEEDEEVQER